MKPYPIVRGPMGQRVPLTLTEKVLFRVLPVYIPVRNRIPLRDVCRKIGYSMEWLQKYWIEDGTLKVWYWRGSCYTQMIWVEAAMRARHPNYEELIQKQREILS